MSATRTSGGKRWNTVQRIIASGRRMTDAVEASRHLRKASIVNKSPEMEKNRSELGAAGLSLMTATGGRTGNSKRKKYRPISQKNEEKF